MTTMTTPTTGLDGLRERAEQRIAQLRRVFHSDADLLSDLLDRLLTALSAAPQGAEGLVPKAYAEQARQIAKNLEDPTHPQVCSIPDAAFFLNHIADLLFAAAPAQDAATGGELGEPKMPLSETSDLYATVRNHFTRTPSPDARELVEGIREHLIKTARDLDARYWHPSFDARTEPEFYWLHDTLAKYDAALPAAPEGRS